jgi:hypothetical protein
VREVQEVAHFPVGQGNGRPTTHFGNPSARSPMMLRWISDVPP